MEPATIYPKTVLIKDGLFVPKLMRPSSMIFQKKSTPISISTRCGMLNLEFANWILCGICQLSIAILYEGKQDEILGTTKQLT